MKIFALSVAAAALGAAMTFSGAASASQIVTCSSPYLGLGTPGESNGTTTLPATDIGTVAAGCQIGNLQVNNVAGTGVFISSPSPLESIFQFEWGGGYLNISEALGNNGTLTGGVDAELGLASGNSVNANGSLASEIASLNFSSPFHFDKFSNLYSGNLGAGTYLIDTYSGTITDDPTFEIDFATTVPEPMSFALLGTGLLGLGLLRRRQMKKIAAV